MTGIGMFYLCPLWNCGIAGKPSHRTHGALERMKRCRPRTGSLIIYEMHSAMLYTRSDIAIVPVTALPGHRDNVISDEAAVLCPRCVCAFSFPDKFAVFHADNDKAQTFYCFLSNYNCCESVGARFFIPSINTTHTPYLLDSRAAQQRIKNKTFV